MIDNLMELLLGAIIVGFVVASALFVWWAVLALAQEVQEELGHWRKQ